MWPGGRPDDKRPQRVPPRNDPAFHERELADMPLPVTALGSTGIETTTLGFGCATLFRAPDPEARSRLLRVAYEAGIRHFDVAPMYGLGRAEAELGAFIQPHRADVTVTTKFGIRPTLAGRYLARVQRPLRHVLASRPAMGNQVRAHPAGPSRLLYELGGYDAANARRGLQQSLRRLRTDYIDLFLLHDPLPDSIRSAGLYEFLEDAVTAGLLRSWGITGAPEVVSEVAQGFPRVPMRQLRGDIFVPPALGVRAGSALITYSAISNYLGLIVGHVRSSESARGRWYTAAGADCGDPEAVAPLLLRAAFRQNCSGVVLFGATRPSHIKVAATIAAQCGPAQWGDLAAAGKPELDSFISLVREELLSPDAARGLG